MLSFVTGPPCGVKTTYVDEHRAPGDGVVDFDTLAHALGGESMWAGNPTVTRLAVTARDAAIDEATRNAQGRDIWVIQTTLPPGESSGWVQDFGAQVVMCDPGQATCLEVAGDPITYLMLPELLAC